MNTPKTISEKIEEFDELILLVNTHVNPNCFSSKFCKPHGEIGIVEYDLEAIHKEIKNFIRQSINEILDSIPLEEKEEIVSSGINGLRDGRYSQENAGYNQAVKEIKEWKESVIK